VDPPAVAPTLVPVSKLLALVLQPELALLQPEPVQP
jgi:hypothetical protein